MVPPHFASNRSWRKAGIGPLLIALLILPHVGVVGAVRSAPARLQTGMCALPSPRTLIANILDSLEWDVVSERAFANVHGEPYREVYVSTSGRVEGCTSFGDPGRGDFFFTDAPDIVLVQFDQLALNPTRAGALRMVRGIASFRAEDGSGLYVLMPESRSAWNGKLFVAQHGGGQAYPRMGELVAREPGASFDARMSRNNYAGLMVDKGYAVAWVRGGGSGGGIDRLSSRTAPRARAA